MRSQIDWNEIVPKLAEGLRQTLFLEAMRMLSNSTPPATSQAERRRRYAITYYQMNKARINERRKLHHKSKRNYRAEYLKRRTVKGTLVTRRSFTPDQKAEIVAFFKEHGIAPTMKKYAIVSSVVRRWAKGESLG